MEKMLEKYKSKDVRKQFIEVKKELLKLKQPENLVVPAGMSAAAVTQLQQQAPDGGMGAASTSSGSAAAAGTSTSASGGSSST